MLKTMTPWFVGARHNGLTCAYVKRLPTAVHGRQQHGAFLPYQVCAMPPIPDSAATVLSLCAASRAAAGLWPLVAMLPK